MTAPAPPGGAEEIFGSRLPLAARFADALCGPGVERGLIGPREATRIWDRHLLNSAALAELIPAGSVLLDVGSGAGLPGIPLAVARPDLHIVLLEPMQRRVAFLDEVIAQLPLDNVRVVRGRAEDPAVRRELGRFPLVTARAVAPLGRLAAWCVPFLTTNGRLLAMKGSRAQIEVDEAGADLAAAGLSAEVLRAGEGVIEPVALVVVLVRGSTIARRRR